MQNAQCPMSKAISAHGIRLIGMFAGVAVTMLVPLSAADDLRLIDAAKSRNIEAVSAVLKTHADVNARQRDGATALHWAAHFDDVAMAELLIRAGARAGLADDTGVTPIYLACTNRSGAMVQSLLAAGADPNATLLNGETALMTCSRTGDARAVKALLARGADVNRKEPFHDQTALMWAAAQRHHEVVAALIAAGADIKARSRTYSQTVTSEVTQRAGREELNYAVPRGGRCTSSIRRPIGRRRVRAVAGRRRGGRQRRAAERHDGARGGRAQRSRGGSDVASRKGCRSQRRGGRLYGAACSRAAKRAGSREGPPRARRESGPADDQGYACQTKQSGFRVARHARWRDTLLLGGQVSRSRHHAGSCRRWCRHAGDDAVG